MEAKVLYIATSRFTIMRYLLSLLFSCCLIATGLIPHPHALYYGTISGTVFYLHQQQRLPVAGALITLAGDNQHTHSDAFGHFTLTRVSPDQHELCISHPQFHDPLKLTVAVQPNRTAHVDAKLGQVYYLAIGIGAYFSEHFPDLSSPPQDAQKMVAALSSSYAGDIRILLDGQATKAEIKATMEQTLAALQPQDYLVFYYSGHGGSAALKDDPQTQFHYLQPVDSNPSDFAHDISVAEFSQWLKKLPNPSHAVCILDSCYAGAFLPVDPHGKGPIILAASSADEDAVDIRSGSLFTGYLLDGLTCHYRATDMNADRIITARELFDYAAPRTAARAKRLGHPQHPKLQLDNDVPLLRY